jgi:RNA 2',3'-cyclic 3'-phosphodiesterase
MSPERLKSPRARLFVALDLPEDVREGLAAWQASALEDEALRALRPEALHVTLCFLGYRPEREIDRIAAVVRSIEPRPVRLRFDAESIPIPRSHPRLFAIGAESEGAVALQGELSSRLESQRFYRPEKRPFWTHVTVARVRPERRPSGDRGRGRRGRPMRVEAPPTALPAELLVAFNAPRVTLYQSLLRPRGAEYAPLAVLDLPSDGRG